MPPKSPRAGGKGKSKTNRKAVSVLQDFDLAGYDGTIGTDEELLGRYFDHFDADSSGALDLIELSNALNAIRSEHRLGAILGKGAFWGELGRIGAMVERK